MKNLIGKCGKRRNHTGRGKRILEEEKWFARAS